MTSLNKLGVYLARLLTVALWVLTAVALNEGLYGEAMVVGVLSWTASLKVEFNVKGLLIQNS